MRVKVEGVRISPVPGGVEPMTIAMLLRNTMNNAARRGRDNQEATQQPLSPPAASSCSFEVSENLLIFPSLALIPSFNVWTCWLMADIVVDVYVRLVSAMKILLATTNPVCGR